MSYNSLFVGTVAGFVLSAVLVRRAAVPTSTPTVRQWRRPAAIGQCETLLGAP